MKVILYTDGACRGNPGPTGAGIVVLDGSRELVTKSVPLGHGTNNTAELTAIKLGLLECKRLGASHVVARTDSEWSMKILSGEYQLKKAHLRPTYDAIKALEKDFENVSYEWIPRGSNEKADMLAREGSYL